MDPQVWWFLTIQHHPSTQRIQRASSSAAGAGALDPGAPQFHAPSADMKAEIWYALALLQVAGMLMMINHKETYYPWQSLEAYRLIQSSQSSVTVWGHEARSPKSCNVAAIPTQVDRSQKPPAKSLRRSRCPHQCIHSQYLWAAP